MRRLKAGVRFIARGIAAWTPSAVQLVSMGVFCLGFFLLAIPVGCIVTGLLGMVVGWALDGER